MRDCDQGFILLSALTVLAILTGLVASSAALVRARVADAEIARRDLKRDALAQAGFALAAYQVFALERSPRAVSGQRIRLSTGVATISISAENGRIDLNGASADLLAGLWRTAGDQSMSPQAFANRVIDWRDPDDVRGLSGAERADYAAIHASGPANAPFQSQDDVRHVLGMTHRSARLLLPFLTVANPTGVVSAMTAPKPALLALPNADEAFVETALRFQRIDDSGGLDAALSDRGISTGLGLGDALRVTVLAEIGSRTYLKSALILKDATKTSVFVIADGDL